MLHPVHTASFTITMQDASREHDESLVDFTNASLYLAGLQTVFSICCCAFVSILACWLVPEGGVSAVRTLALCTATGALLMRKPLRVGKVHGVKVIFGALQPSIGIYLLALVVEQLVHTCTSETTHAPSWRRVVFHAMMALMLVAAIMRARQPLQDTDMPFLITAAALLTIAALPPPAVALLGPLCQSVNVWDAAERMVRSFAFAVVYCAHVYASTSCTSETTSETILVVTRSASAALWTTGAHVSWLPAAIVQCGIVITSRLSLENTTHYKPLSETTVADEADLGKQPTAALPAHPLETEYHHQLQQRHLQSSAEVPYEYDPSHIPFELTCDPLHEQDRLLGSSSGSAIQYNTNIMEMGLSSGPKTTESAGAQTANTIPDEHRIEEVQKSGYVSADQRFAPRAFRDFSTPTANTTVPQQPHMNRQTPPTQQRMAEIAAAIVDSDNNTVV